MDGGVFKDFDEDVVSIWEDIIEFEISGWKVDYF